MRIVCIDLGNSLVKIGFFESSRLKTVEAMTWGNLMNSDTIQQLSSCVGMVCSVLSPQENERFKTLFPNFRSVDENVLLPLASSYSTPLTLGKDRLCNAIGAWSKNKHRNSLVIDIGTCLKFDFVSQQGIYQGGSIAPGIGLRYRSLHDYTANLPLISTTDTVPLIGSSTKECVESGVMNGMHAEIERLIEAYQQRYEELTIFVTGGDAKHFDLLTKNNIFAIDHLTLIGLHEIFSFNAK